MEETYRGFRRENFEFSGRAASVISPESPLPGKKWLWRAEFLGAFDAADVEMLRRGYYLAYYSCPNLYGGPLAQQLFTAFYGEMTARGFSPRPVLLGFSRGGLYAVNFAAEHPQSVGALYLDAPVLDIASWPGGKGAGCGSPREFEDCLALYSLTEETVSRYAEQNAARFDAIIGAGIPVALVAGDSDGTVPYGENGALLASALRAAGAEFYSELKPGCGHHPHGAANPGVLCDWIEKHAKF